MYRYLYINDFADRMSLGGTQSIPGRVRSRFLLNVSAHHLVRSIVLNLLSDIHVTGVGRNSEGL